MREVVSMSDDHFQSRGERRKRRAANLEEQKKKRGGRGHRLWYFELWKEVRTCIVER